MCPAIHITSRSWLRSSSTHEPSDPPLRVVCHVCGRVASRNDHTSLTVQRQYMGRDRKSRAGRRRPTKTTFFEPSQRACGSESADRSSPRPQKTAERARYPARLNRVDCWPPAGFSGRPDDRSMSVLVCLYRVRPPPRHGTRLGNDPSAGSPTETLLRLLLPLDDQV